MSNPTTPFGWQMPTNTDLVTDLPADFEVFGQAVATSMQDLLGGTTGQILSKASGTDMDFTWTSANPGDITGVTAGVGISGGGTSGDVTVTNSMATAITTSGDLVQGTGSGTFARLATGTNGQYLTTNGTTNSWVTPANAGGLTLISETVASANSSINLTSIPGTYKQLMLVWSGLYPSNATSVFSFRLNNVSTSDYAGVITPITTPIEFQSDNADDVNSSGGLFGYNSVSTSTLYYQQVMGMLIIDNYASTSKFKFYNGTGSYRAGAIVYVPRLNGVFKSTSAITSIDIVRISGTATLSNAADTSIRLYGLS